MVILKLMSKSLGQRAGRATLSILALAFSFALLLVISHIHEAVRSYARQVSSEADLVISAPTQPMHLVLYSLFGIGTPPPALPWSVYEDIAAIAEVAWAAPVSTSKSHEGFTVTASTPHYLGTLQLQAVNFIGRSEAGTTFRNERSAFIGANLGHLYHPGEVLPIAHDRSAAPEEDSESGFIIQGVLLETGTSLDNNILVPIDGLRQTLRAEGMPSDVINFMLIKLRDPGSLAALQQRLQEAYPVALTVVNPASELARLGYYERMLNRVFMAMSFIIGLLSLMMIFFNLATAFAERRDEVELLRMVGARPWQLAGLTLAEPLLQMMLALFGGGVFYLLSTFFLGNWIPLVNRIDLPLEQLFWLLLLFLLGFALACLPAWRMYGVSKKT